MINILNNALKNISTKSMKIRLICDRMTMNMDDIKTEVWKLVRILKSATFHFMIIGKFRINVKDQISFDGMKHDLLIKSKVTLQSETDKLWQFVFSNIGCKIAGYQEKWLMECACCRQPYQ